MMASSDSTSAVAGGLARHIPVLGRPAVEFLALQAGGVYIDATFGAGGYSRAILDAANCRVIGLDRDQSAIARGAELVQAAGGRLVLVEDKFSNLQAVAAGLRHDAVDGVVFDLGVSSMQLDDASRGFSFRLDAPLDMRMGPDSTTAATLVNGLEEHELARILREYGEEPMARRIARAIVEARQSAPIETTGQLAAIVRSVKKSKPRDIDPATLTFQALRIAANEELVGLDRFIDDAVSVLESGARIAVISFHSLEDRIVKRALRRLEGECTCPPAMPVCGCGAKEVLRVLTGRPVTASEDEVNRNPRSRSAKLRVAEKK
jgi:16S rRNA (cytosine1402-N4)-methyltransferase